jgi:hypothetical protein
MGGKMYPYTVKVSPKNRYGSILFSTLATLTALVLLLGILVPMHIDLFSAIALFLGSGAIWVYMRYLYGFYIYEVDCIDFEYVLFIRQNTGKKTVTHMSVSVSDISCMTVEDAVQIKNHTQDKNITKYTYMQTFLPKKRIYLRYDNRYEVADVFIEYDAGLEKILFSLMSR